jgi:superfamily II DNA or RNA helicase
MEKLNKPTSYSQNTLFIECPRTWYLKKVLGVPGEEDLKYAHRGSVVHYTIEEYYKKGYTEINESLKEYFRDQWYKHNLDKTSLKTQYDNSWRMVENGIGYGLNITDVEEELVFDDARGFIDAGDKDNLIITDWKTSTRSEHNEKSYKAQLIYYAWLYYRKHGVILKKAQVKYLKYSDERSTLSVRPTLAAIKKAEAWNRRVRAKMEYYLNNPDKLPCFNRDYFFSPYKHLFGTDQDIGNVNVLTVRHQGHYLKLEGAIPKRMVALIDNEFQYTKKDAYYIRRRNPNANTEVHFYNKNKDKIPAGFKPRLAKIIKKFQKENNSSIKINYVDERQFNGTTIEYPSALKDIQLRDYQQRLSDLVVKNPGYWMVELATGGGKSYVIVDIIRRLRCKTLVVVDKIELLEQLKRDFEGQLGVKVGVINSEAFEYEDLTIASIQTLRKRLNVNERVNDVVNRIKGSRFDYYNEQVLKVEPPTSELIKELKEKSKETFAYKKNKYVKARDKFFKRYQLTTSEQQQVAEQKRRFVSEKKELQEYLGTVRVWITDEAHKIAAYSYYTLGRELNNTEYRLGFTGTAYRDDGNDMMITAVSGYKIYSHGSEELIKDGVLMNPDIVFVKYDMPAEYALELNNKSMSGLINETPNYMRFYENFVVKNKVRNKVIERLVDKECGKQTLIVVKYIEHGEYLQGVVEGAEYLNGKTPKKQRANMIERFKNGELKVLISTISIFAEGINVPNLEVIINASANSGDVKTVQLLGRLLRKLDGKVEVTMYDFVDTEKFFKTASYNRLNRYVKSGHDINVVDAEYLNGGEI